MAETASAFVTDPWQGTAAGHRISSSSSMSTERLLSILRVDTVTVPKKVLEPNRSADDEARAEPQVSGEGTRRTQPAELLPEVLPAVLGESKLDRFKLLQKWEGTVVHCSEAEFTAVLREKGEPD